MASSRLAYLGRLLRRLWIFLAGYAAVVLIATFGFYFLESGSPGLLNSLYWAMITLSTIGYGDVVPNDPLAKVFTIGIAATEVFLGAYLVSIIIAGVQEEGQHRALGTLGTNLSGHVVVLGYGPVGRAAVRELLAQEEKVAVVADDPADVANLRLLADDKHLFATYGPAGDLEILRRVNVPGALAVIVCTPDDTVTLVAALNVRELSPNGRIVVSVGRPELRHTLRAAGVTYVTSPGDMGGRICADALVPAGGRQHDRGPYDDRVRGGPRGVRPFREDPRLPSAPPRGGAARPLGERLPRRGVRTSRREGRVPDGAEPSRVIQVPTGGRAPRHRDPREPAAAPPLARGRPGPIVRTTEPRGAVLPGVSFVVYA